MTTSDIHLAGTRSVSAVPRTDEQNITRLRTLIVGGIITVLALLALFMAWDESHRPKFTINESSRSAISQLNDYYGYSNRVGDLKLASGKKDHSYRTMSPAKKEKAQRRVYLQSIDLAQALSIPVYVVDPATHTRSRIGNYQVARNYSRSTDMYRVVVPVYQGDTFTMRWGIHGVPGAGTKPFADR